MVRLIGPKKITLSPPKNNWGSNRVKRVTKLMFSPVANGRRPRTVVIAVNKTGRSLLLPPKTIAFLT